MTTKPLDQYVLWETVVGPKTGSLPPVQGWDPNPLVVGDLLIACLSSGETGRIAAFDRSSGSEQWEYGLDYLGGRPVRSANGLVVASSSRTLVALDAETGRVAWSWRPTHEPGEWIYTLPCVEGDSCFVGDRRGRLTRLDLQDGSEAWSVQPFEDDPSQVNASPFISDDLVLGADLRGRVFALDRITGSLRWSQELENASISALGATTSGGIVVRTQHCISELAPSTGAVVRAWDSERPLWHHAVWDGGVIAVVQGEIVDEPDTKRMVNGSIVRLERGEVLWETKAIGSNQFVRVLPAQRVVVEVGGFDVRVLDLGTGDPLLTATSGESDYGVALPEVRGGVMYRLLDRWGEGDDPDKGADESRTEGDEQEGILQALDWSRLVPPREAPLA